MKYLLYSTFFFFCFHSFAQDLNLNLQYSFGGSGSDNLAKTIRLSNGNYVMFGTSNSPVSGTKTEGAFGQSDWWIVCLDASYNELWQKTLGGSLDDYANTVKELSNGDLLFLGFSESPNNGNKQSVCYGANDYWIVRMTNSGTILWDKTYGGSALENSSDVYELNGGNLIVSGSSASGVSGNKSIASNGAIDIWLLKLNPSGNILAQAEFGGDSFDYDGLILRTGSNELLLAGSSSSGISGNKTVANLGEDDAWIIKIDTSLNLINQYVVGGNDIDYAVSFIHLNNGNFLLTFASSSSAGGMKSENGYGSNDAWLVELNSNFNVVRDKTIGSNYDENITKTHQLNNGNILLLMNTYSDANVYKSENSLGWNDFWFVSLDENWDVTYENTIGSTGNDAIMDMIKNNNGELVFFGLSSGGIDNDKTCTTNGQNDFWVVTAQTDLSVNPKLLSDPTIYPNPTESTIYFKDSGFSGVTYQVLDIRGKILLTGIIYTEQIDLSELNSGTYLISIKNTHYKVVKQ